MKRVIDISKLTMNAVLFHGELFDEYKRDAERAIKESVSLESEVLKALEDVRAEIEDIDGITEIGAQILDEVLGIIDRKIKEIEHDNS